MGRLGPPAAVVAVLVAGLLSGCSGTASAPAGPSASAAPSATPAPPGSAPELAPAPVPVPVPVATPTGTPQEQALAWTESVCGALVPVVARLTTAPPLDLNAPEATRQAYLTYLGEGLAETDRARAALAAAGPAPVAGGDVIADQIRGDLADLRSDVADARSQVERAQPGSAAGLGRALISGSNLVGALVNGAKVAGRINRDPVLRAAYDRAPSCARLQRSGAPAPATR